MKNGTVLPHALLVMVAGAHFMTSAASTALRTAIFGFSSHLQLVHGRVDEQGVPRDAPYLADQGVYDSKVTKFTPPAYLGLAVLDDCLMFLDIDELGYSLYSHLLEREDGLLTMHNSSNDV